MNARARRVGIFVARVSVLVYLAGSLLAWSARWSYWGELAASLSWQLALVGTLLALVLCLTRCVRESVIATALSVIHAWPFVPLAWARRETPPQHASAAREQRLRVVSANLLFGNPLQRDLVEWARFADADVLVLLELSPEGRRSLATLRGLYPEQLVHPPAETWSAGTWGLALLSRLPLVDPRAVDLGESVFPMLDAGVRSGTRVLRMRAVHFPDPSDALRLDARRVAIAELPRLFEWNDGTILMGDLNVPTASPDFARVLELTQLRDSRRAFGRQPTWTQHGVPFELALDLDHVLVGSAFVVVDRKRLEIPGSDHCAVCADLCLR